MIKIRTSEILLLLTYALFACEGCYAPLRSPGIPANCLDESFRTPFRTAGAPLNLCSLTVRQPLDYALGSGDILEVTIPELYESSGIRPLLAQVMSDGRIHLPLVGAVNIGGMNLLEAQATIERAYRDGFLENPRINVAIAQKAVIRVLVLGEVETPGVHELQKFENDVGHALAAAGGLGEKAADTIEVHRRLQQGDTGAEVVLRLPKTIPLERIEPDPVDPKKVLTIPLRGLPPGFLTADDVLLNNGDVVVVPNRRHEIFFVVGRLAQTSFVRFSVREEERELGTAFILPRDREVDVVTAVTMAGYIDPIDSPTTVTVHRLLPDGSPMLIHVDLISARYDRRETILVQPGDIIYLNPDAAWWFRRTFDRIVPDLLTTPWRAAFENWIPARRVR